MYGQTADEMVNMPLQAFPVCGRPGYCFRDYECFGIGILNFNCSSVKQWHFQKFRNMRGLNIGF